MRRSRSLDGKDSVFRKAEVGLASRIRGLPDYDMIGEFYVKCSARVGYRLRCGMVRFTRGRFASGMIVNKDDCLRSMSNGGA